MQSIERVFKVGDKVSCPLWETYAMNHFGADEFEVRRVTLRYSSHGRTRLVYDIAVKGLYIDAVEANELRLIRERS